ncbi:hypothetical protein BS50DRAFT_576728 [Corynespora cassiicola Philippines]|uniref:Ankyrin n=1 Tax=Corynespora cassiicola Philippines TaxID=1448308 RepID=A0A2T2NFH0_CORCC|nr:hypothetical protein BS50DRAFT_576728 [Corynespora cassiicola Philippines]
MEIVGAVASLAQICAGVMTGLQHLVGTYQQSDNIILSVLDECENLKLAWLFIRRWVESQRDQPEELAAALIDRFKKSIASGKQLMEALEKDIERAKNDEPGRLQKYKRKTYIVWKVKAFSEHQERIRGQIEALTLLIVILRLPYDEERLEVLSSPKASIFERTDEEASSIFRAGISTETDNSSIRTTNTISSSMRRFVVFAFDGALKETAPYRRSSTPSVSITEEVMATITNDTASADYRSILSSSRSPSTSTTRHHSLTQPSSGSLSRLSSDISGRSSRTHGHSFLGAFNANDRIELDFSLSIEEEGQEEMSVDEDSDEPVIPPPMPKFTEDILYAAQSLESSFVTPAQVSRLSRAVEDGDLETATQNILDAMDIVELFQSDATPSFDITMSFFYHVDQNNPELFSTVLRRIAYTAGKGWTKTLKRAYLRYVSQHDTARDESPPTTSTSAWSSITRAAGLADDIREAVKADDPASSPLSAIQLTCALGDEAVLKYLLRIGASPWPNPDAWGHPSPFKIGSKENFDDPLALAIMRHCSTDFVDALIQTPFAPKNHEDAIRAMYLSLHPEFTHWSRATRKAQNWTADWETAAAIPIHLKYKATEQINVGSRDRYISFLHAAIWNIHLANSPQEQTGALLSAILPAPDMDFRGCYLRDDDTRVTPLVLATLCNEPGMVRALLDKGAKVFQSSEDVWKKMARGGKRYDVSRRVGVLGALHDFQEKIQWDAKGKTWFMMMRDRYSQSRPGAGSRSMNTTPII